MFALTNLEKRDKIHIGYEKPDLPMKDCETYEIEETKEEYLEKAKNKVCGEYIYAYPPGSPIIAPGEIISDKFVCQIKKLYESGMPTDDITKQEHISKRTIYKYLNLAYLSPKIVNQLLNGTLTVNLQKLFEIASKKTLKTIDLSKFFFKQNKLKHSNCNA